MPRHRLPAAFRPRQPGAGMHVHDGDASWLPGRPAEQVPAFRGTRIGGACAPNRTSRGPFSGLRAHPPACRNSCRNAVYTVILHYLGTPLPFAGRGGAAEPARLANDAVTPAEPDAKRRSGRRRWRPRPPPPIPTFLPPRPPAPYRRRLPVQGPRARSVAAPVARSSGECTVRQHAAQPGRMPRVLA